MMTLNGCWRKNVLFHGVSCHDSNRTTQHVLNQCTWGHQQNNIIRHLHQIKKKKNITLEIKIVLEAYITMDFDVLGCNYEIFSFCQTAIGEKLMKNSKEQQLFINLKKRLWFITAVQYNIFELINI